jgi:hypothetical protein
MNIAVLADNISWLTTGQMIEVDRAFHESEKSNLCNHE